MKRSNTIYQVDEANVDTPNAPPSISPATQSKIEHEAVTEAAKETIKQTKEHSDKLTNLATRGRISLFKTHAVFPFDLFPDEISIEPDQVNICLKSFFLTAESRSIPIKNIADIYISTSFLFASLRIIDNSYMENSVEIDYLKKNDAEKIRRIIQGLIIASKEAIDLSKIEPKKLAMQAERIGEMQGVDWQVQ